MINFLEAVKHQLHQFVETGHCKPVHLMQNYLINDIYHAIDNKQIKEVEEWIRKNFLLEDL